VPLVGRDGERLAAARSTRRSTRAREGSASSARRLAATPRRAGGAAAAAREASGHIATITPRTMTTPPSQIHTVSGFKKALKCPTRVSASMEAITT
jgi:hypothetical protein